MGFPLLALILSPLLAGDVYAADADQPEDVMALLERDLGVPVEQLSETQFIERGTLREGIWRVVLDSARPDCSRQVSVVDVDVAAGTVTSLHEGDGLSARAWMRAADTTRREGPVVGGYDPSAAWTERRASTWWGGHVQGPELLLEEPSPYREPLAPARGVAILPDGAVIAPELLGVFSGLEQAVADPHPRVQERALERLTSLQADPDYRSMLSARFRDAELALLTDGDVGVRYAALRALASGDSESQELATEAFCDPTHAARLGSLGGPTGWPVGLVPMIADDAACLERALPQLHALDSEQRTMWLDALQQLPVEQHTLALTILLATADPPQALAAEVISRSGIRAGTCHALVPALIDTGLAGRASLRPWIRGCIGPGDIELVKSIVQAATDGLLPPEALAALPPETPGYYLEPARATLEVLLDSDDRAAAKAAEAMLRGTSGW